MPPHPLQVCLRLRNWLRREDGQDVAEYAVIVVFISILVIAGISGFGAQVKAIWDGIVAFARSLHVP